jgi:hypothetical protein
LIQKRHTLNIFPEQSECIMTRMIEFSDGKRRDLTATLPMIPVPCDLFESRLILAAVAAGLPALAPIEFTKLSD